MQKRNRKSKFSVAQRRKLAHTFAVPTPAENRYVRGLRAVLAAVHDEYMAFMLPKLSLVGKHTDARSQWGSELDALGIRIHTQVGKKVDPLVQRMASEVIHGKTKERGKVLGITVRTEGVDAVKLAEFRDRNISLVENAARVYAEDVRNIFESPEALGRRVEDLKADLLSRGNVSESRAELIARDQTLKLNGQINEARQTAAGVDKYTWSTSRDERVRESHAELEGEVFDWSSPPEVGHPGQDFQCRCVAVPYVEELERI